MKGFTIVFVTTTLLFFITMGLAGMKCDFDRIASGTTPICFPYHAK